MACIALGEVTGGAFDGHVHGRAGDLYLRGLDSHLIPWAGTDWRSFEFGLREGISHGIGIEACFVNPHNKFQSGEESKELSVTVTMCVQNTEYVRWYSRLLNLNGPGGGVNRGLVPRPVRCSRCIQLLINNRKHLQLALTTQPQPCKSTTPTKMHPPGNHIRA